MSFTAILDILLGALAILLVFGLAVFVHEFGHMFFALIRGVGVESFAIGMGPKITSWKWRGIEFSLRWIPAGGFVKLKGMMPEELEEPAVAESEAAAGDLASGHHEDKELSESAYDDLLALRDEGLVTKLLVFGGGVFMNFVTAIVAAALLGFVGTKAQLFPIELEQVPEASLLAELGVEPGDRIVAFDGAPTPYSLDLQQAVIEKTGGPMGVGEIYHRFLAGVLPYVEPPDEPTTTVLTAMELTVERGGENRRLALEGITNKQLDRLLDEVTLNMRIPPIVGELIPNYPADRAGIKRGDRIVAIDGEPIESFSDMTRLIAARPGVETRTTVEREGEQLELTVIPRRDVLKDKPTGQIGVFNGAPDTRVLRETPFRAITLAPVSTMQAFLGMLNLNVQFFKRATAKDISQNLGGPIAIAVMTFQRAMGGISELLDWFIMLNLLLMFFNLLPLPVLDGGFIVLSLIEAVIRRPVPTKILAPIYTVFVIFFITLMVAISGLDIWNWFISPLM
ncbi:MAG: Regulator of sigma-E protease RseP [candidate division BRC1 bacterium ADurb.BinA292]|nr:MAG: Regulator of sigma-E protease RseP [candidate division BRC1 bacterium ADurb.BinA292]